MSSEYLGMLTIVAVVVAVLVASGIARLARAEVGRLNCHILTPPGASTAHCDTPRAGSSAEREAPSARDRPGGEPREAAAAPGEAQPSAAAPDRAAGEPDGYCVLSAESFKAGLDLTLGLFDLGQGTGFVLEERSDGTYGVTWLEKNSLGASVALEAGGALHLGARSIGLQGSLRAGGAGTVETADTAVFTDRGAIPRYLVARGVKSLAKRVNEWGRVVARAGSGLIDRVVGHDPAAAMPEERSVKIGFDRDFLGKGSVGVLEADVHAVTDGAVEVARQADGDREFAVLLSAEAGADAGLPGFRELQRAQLGATRGLGFLASFTMNTRNEVTNLRVNLEAKGSIDAAVMDQTASKPGFFKQLGGSLRTADNERTVIEYELDTTAPEVAQAARRFLAAAPRLGEPPGDRRRIEQAGGALWDQALRHSTLNVQRYQDHRLAFGPEGRLRAGVGGSFDAKLEKHSSDLLDAHYWDNRAKGFRPRRSCAQGVP